MAKPKPVKPARPPAQAGNDAEPMPVRAQIACWNCGAQKPEALACPACEAAPR